MEDMSDSITNMIVVVVSTCYSLCTLMMILRKSKRTKGKGLRYYVGFILAAGVVALFIPEYVEDIIFSSGGVLVIGTLTPIYESIRAEYTIDESDDREWLQY